MAARGDGPAERLKAGTAGMPTWGDEEELLEALVARLRAEGAPAGVWLVQISQVRQALQAADNLLLELSDAILNQLPPLT